MTGKCIYKESVLRYSGHKNENGMVIPTVLIFLSTLSLLGGIAYMTTSTDLKIAGNYRVAKKAFYTSEAGVAEARARLRLPASDNNRIADPVAAYDPWWSAYILADSSWQTTDDSGYDANYRNYIPHSGSQTSSSIVANSFQSALKYAVKIRHKREYDAEQTGHTASASHYYDGDGDTSANTAASPGSIVYYGYGNPGAPATATQFTAPGATAHKPVDIITAYGADGTSIQIIEVEVIAPPPPLINSALYAKGNVTGNGSSLSVDGDDNCGSAASLPPVYTLAPSSTTLNGTPIMGGSPAAPTNGPSSVDIAGYINSLKGSAGVTILSDQNGINYGTGTSFVTCYSDTSNPNNVNGLTLQNVTGYGVLLVDGDLTLGGGFNWNGVILCSGVLTFNGGGAGVNIQGAVLAEQTVSINGGLDIRYDSCMIDDAFNTQGRKVISWRQIH